MKDLPTLTSDPDGELVHTDMNRIENLVCKDHDFAIDYPNREVHCKKCGYGYKFQVHKMSFKDGKLVKRGENLTNKGGSN